uniref:Uncharacterized protein n=1 Tax=Arundo donax TaxID=35708 RepID=A0A0A9GQ95_ARUDO
MFHLHLACYSRSLLHDDGFLLSFFSAMQFIPSVSCAQRVLTTSKDKVWGRIIRGNPYREAVSNP